MREARGFFSVLMKDAPLAALDLEVPSLPKERAGTDQRQKPR